MSCILKYDRGNICIDPNIFLQYLYDDHCGNIQILAEKLLKKEGIKEAGEYYSNEQVDEKLSEYLPENRDLFTNIAYGLLENLENQMENDLYGDPEEV